MNGNEDQCYPVINVEETIGKTVGSRKPRRAMTQLASRKVDMERWREVTGGVGIPRGVYRFTSHEEADAWMMKNLVATAVKRAS
jgi:hypothetical protein